MCHFNCGFFFEVNSDTAHKLAEELDKLLKVFLCGDFSSATVSYKTSIDPLLTINTRFLSTIRTTANSRKIHMKSKL